MNCDSTEAHAPASTVLFEDDFTCGIDDRWTVLVGAGVVAPSPTGITIAPPGRNASGEPVFGIDVPQPMAHLKWFAASSEAFETNKGELRFRYRAAATCYGVTEHPFGADVGDAHADLRLAAGTVHALDFATGIVFDFWVTNSAVYAFYERIQLGSDSTHQAFSSIAPPVRRKPRTVHDLCITVNVASGTVRWEVDGTTVGMVTEIGVPADGFTVIIDHGGTPEAVTPSELAVGLGLLTLLDAASPDGVPSTELGLVDLAGHLVRPSSYRGGPTRFGQGATLSMERVSVERT